MNTNDPSTDKKAYATTRFAAAMLMVAARPKKKPKMVKSGCALLPDSLAKAADESARKSFDPEEAASGQKRPRKVYTEAEKKTMCAAKEKRRKERIQEYSRTLREILDLPQRPGTNPNLSKLRREREVLAFRQHVKVSTEVAEITDLAIGSSELGTLLHECARYVPTIDREADFRMAVCRLLPVFRFLKRGLTKAKVAALCEAAEAVQLEFTFAAEFKK